MITAIPLPTGLQARFKELAEARTVFYYYSKETIRQNCRLFQHITYPEKAIHFATMANTHPEFLKVIREEGIKVFVNSLCHLDEVRTAGFNGEEIIYTASAMDEDTMRTVKEQKVLVNLDSLAQVELWERLFPGTPCGVRCNIGEAVMPRKTRGGYFIGNESRLGLSREELATLHGRQTVRGLHLYVGTDILDISYFMDCYRELIRLSSGFPALEYLDFGGGFGVKETETETEFDMLLYSRLVTALMEDFSGRTGRRIRLILEPGRILGAAAGHFICRVVDVKFRGNKQLVGVNASSVQFPRPLFYPESAVHPVSLLPANGRAADDTELTTSIYGCSTYSRDFLAREVKLPQVHAGDVIVFGNAGSYCAASHTSFLGFPRAEEIFE